PERLAPARLILLRSRLLRSAPRRSALGHWLSGCSTQPLMLRGWSSSASAVTLASSTRGSKSLGDFMAGSLCAAFGMKGDLGGERQDLTLAAKPLCASSLLQNRIAVTKGTARSAFSWAGAPRTRERQLWPVPGQLPQLAKG